MESAPSTWKIPNQHRISWWLGIASGARHKRRGQSGFKWAVLHLLPLPFLLDVLCLFQLPNTSSLFFSSTLINDQYFFISGRSSNERDRETETERQRERDREEPPLFPPSPFYSSISLSVSFSLSLLNPHIFKMDMQINRPSSCSSSSSLLTGCADIS